MADNTQDDVKQDEINVIAVRQQKLKELRQSGQAFPNDFQRQHFAEQLLQEFSDKTTEELNILQQQAVLAGRMMLRRVMGKASFVHLQDKTGRIQLYLRKDQLAEEQYDAFKTWDLGDIIGVKGILFKTKTGELTVQASGIYLLSKSLRPPPEKFHGLSDTELCYRQRYVDLMVNQETRERFLLRSKLIQCLREFLCQHDFLEVETPMLQPIPGGALAKPFVTHHHSLAMDMYLRIAPELYLKRLVVGGFERVFEINRSFRNEGLSTQHNPEFTMLEFYQAYATYLDLMDFTETMLRYLAEQVLQTTTLRYQDHEIDLSKAFTRMTLKEAIHHYNPDIPAGELDDLATAKKWAKTLGVELQKHYGLGKIQLEIFEKTVEHQLIQPTFITAYPTEVSPLARQSDQDPFLTDRFELFVVGRELANGFSELNDPEEQSKRFKQQQAERKAGDQEAMTYDADYIRALEYGMPPTAGEGIGIDRLVMLFGNAASIRDVILFPHMRPEAAR